MSAEEKLLAAARKHTGDDSITEVAEFLPKGTTGATLAGAAAGAAAGGAVGGDWGQAIGIFAGGTAGKAAMGVGRDLPPFVAIAVSPETVYLLGMKHQWSYKHMDLFGQIPRDRLGVEIHQRLSVRTIVLEDLETQASFALEAPKINVYHGKAMVELLMLSAQHHDEEPSEEEIEAANV